MHFQFFLENLTSTIAELAYTSIHRVCGFLVILTFTRICFVILMPTILTKIKRSFNSHFSVGEPDWTYSSSVYQLIFYLRTLQLNCFLFLDFPHKEIVSREATFCGSGVFEIPISMKTVQINVFQVIVTQRKTLQFIIYRRMNP